MELSDLRNKLFILFLAFPIVGLAETIKLSDSGSMELIGRHLEYALSDGEVFDPTLLEYDVSESEVPNLGLGAGDLWIRLKLLNTTSDPSFDLFIPYPILDEVVLFSHKNGLKEMARSGEVVPVSEREIVKANIIFPLELPEGSEQVFYLRIRSSEQLILPMYVGRRDAVNDFQSLEYVLNGVYFGIILIMILYNLFVFISVKDRSYVFYVLYILFTGLTQLGIKGFTFEFLWPSFGAFQLQSLTVFGALGSIFGLVFTRQFLQTRKYLRITDKFFPVVILILLVGIAFSFFNQLSTSFMLMQVGTIGTVLLILFTSFQATFRGTTQARFFLVAWVVLMIGAIIFLFKDAGLLPYNAITNYAMVGASAIETSLLSFALADRINVFKKESEDAQERELGALQEKEKLVREQNIVLEQRVRERTEELQLLNDQLQDTLKELKQAQVQLVNAEKMASLGQLTAGIAHEINNPINFVAASVNPLRKDFDDVKLVLAKYEEQGDSPDQETIRAIEAYKQSIDLSFTLQEIDDLLKGVEEGAHRTAEIVQGLKNFSRLDESDSKFADIHQGLDSTIVIMKSLLKGNVEIVKDYDQSISEIECFPGKLNQVFSNVLMNAQQALQEADMGDKTPRIEISTKNLGEKIRVIMKDNGPGIPEEIKNKIFEPFFTTKDVGEGTGLGLSIVYSIIEQHHGTIELESELGKGTAFIITVPKALN